MGYHPAKKAKTDKAAKHAGGFSPGSHSGSSTAVAIVPVPAFTTESVQAAHDLIDLAKAGDWTDVYEALDKRRELVNMRPKVRDYAVLHQAACHGRADVLTILIDNYGADPLQRTKLGKTVADIASEWGYPDIARIASDRSAAAMSDLSVGAASCAAVPVLTPEKVKGRAKAKAKAKAKAAAAKVCGPVVAFGGSCGVSALSSLPGAAVATPVPTLTSDVLRDAHKLLDTAKAGHWKDLYRTLDTRRELVNIRPDMREFSVLHQAAFHGMGDVVATLINKYGADPSQQTKHGLSAVDVAREQGHAKLAESLEGRAKGVVPEDDAPHTDSECIPDDLPDIVQMPDGSWKVVAASGANHASPNAESEDKATPSAEEATAESDTHSTFDTTAGSRAGYSSSSSACASGLSVSSVTASVAGEGKVADRYLPEASEFHVYGKGGTNLSCTLKRMSKHACTLQLLESNSGEDGYWVCACWGPTETVGRWEADHFSSEDDAVAAFKAKFHEKTCNRWEDRSRFKPFFGKLLYDGSVDAPHSLLKA